MTAAFLHLRSSPLLENLNSDSKIYEHRPTDLQTNTHKGTRCRLLSYLIRMKQYIGYRNMKEHVRFLLTIWVLEKQ